MSWFNDFQHQHKLTKQKFKQQLPELRATLLELQHQLRDAPFPVVVVFAGVDGAGKSDIVAQLNEWMDPRWLINRAYTQPSQEEQERPEFWRYWRDMPPKGQIGLFLSAWYSQPLLQKVKRQSTDAELSRQLERIQRFERMLTDDGALVLKFWLHLDKKQQKKHLKALDSDPLTEWRVTDMDWAHWAMYDRFIGAAEQILDATHTQQAPWEVVDGKDPHYRTLHIAKTIQTAIERHMAQQKLQSSADNAVVTSESTLYKPSTTNHLAAVYMQSPPSKAVYEQQLAECQANLNALYRTARQQGKSLLLVFEGWDAAGKGGSIRRVLHALDPKYYRVVPIAAPTQEEHAQHYLWRFWRHLPRAGRATVFDRSWYGRVLVERIEGFATETEWQRAYQEINEFEQELSEAGNIICKFWLHIDNDEQLRRFEDRGETPHKAWKLTDEDWRNRDKWDDYVVAVNDMLDLTSTPEVPWAVIPANHKTVARLTVLQTICQRLQGALE